MPNPRILRRIGLVCLGLMLATLSLAIPLRCLGKAALVGGFSALMGATLGATLAGITRTRRPALIYLYLVVAALTFAPLIYAFPPADIWEVHPPRAWARFLHNYLDAVRMLLFLLGIPFPFALLGYHAPDPLSSEAEQTGAAEKTIVSAQAEETISRGEAS